ncbi:MAG: phosphoribosylaminoimidazolesuccinocarboxamide synthase [Myxococcota bacterium]
MLTQEHLQRAVPQALARTARTDLGERDEGKVRDIYVVGDRRILITTDRVSAFDRVLGLIPYKGQVLNQLSVWWFNHLSDLVQTHLIHSPDPNIVVTREAQPLPVEVVVRGFITGSTSTALWTLYSQGVEQPYGLNLPQGLVKNAQLPQPVITPTTKAERGQHDERLSHHEVLERGLIAPDLWAEVQETALALFTRGQEVAARAGLLLVDTKYEFGLIDGRLTLIDEVHTPDSSRYWVADSYDAAMREGSAPEHFDKEFLRLWFGARGYKGEGQPPEMPAEFAAQVAGRYIAAYERLTGKLFEPGEQPAAERIAQLPRSAFGV